MNQKVELPDTDKMFEMIDEIREKSIKKGVLEIKIRKAESEITKESMSNPKYFRDGKPPSQSFIDSAYKYAGFDDELLSIREEILTLKSEIDYIQTKFDLYKTLIDIWRTQSRNERNSLE
jgi:hypothetical protein